MKGNANGTLGTRIAKALAAACTVVIIMVVGLVDLSRTAPGPLSSVHGSLEALAGMENCAACHGGWFGDMPSACLECHDAVDADIETGSGLHGTHPNSIDARRCGICHGEHNGSGFQIAGPRSFVMAGVGAREDIDHSRFGFEMAGNHLELDCVECHSAADVDVLQDGQSRFQRLDSKCASCHETSHSKVYPTDCSTCHSQLDFKSPEWPDHELVFERMAAHADASCDECHEPETETSIDSRLLQLRERSSPRDCVDCHDALHSKEFLAEVSLQVDAITLSESSSCKFCHDIQAGDFLAAAEAMNPELHAASGFALDVPHEQVACEKCHSGETQAERFSVRDPRVCATCHSDPHAGQFLEEGETLTDCLACHSPLAFEPTLFDGQRHEALGFQLVGSHAALKCAGCHFEEEDVRGFRGTDMACASCHDDAHDAFFEKGESQGDCAACHGVDKFSDYKTEAFDHGLSCGFDLDGAHGQSECATCHQQQSERDTNGREFGRFEGFSESQASVLVNRPFEKTAQCALCHSSPHGEVFASEGDATASQDCARCHVATSFRLAGEAFDHASTGFALAGKHAGQTCSACHVRESRASVLEASHHAARATDCAGCHADPHGGQFAEKQAGSEVATVDCARCHEPTRVFLEPHFNHNFDSDFRLEGKHRELACSACHASELTDTGESVIRYKPISKDCSACHGQQEDGRLRKDG